MLFVSAVSAGAAAAADVFGLSAATDTQHDLTVNAAHSVCHSPLII